MRAYTLLLVLTMAGCATSYQSKGLTGGFTESRLAEDVYRIRFRGNAYTSEERTNDFALLRAAELCAANGFAFFVVIDEESKSRATAVNQQGRIQYKPASGLLVQMFRNKPDNAFAYEAAYVATSLRSKYGLR